MVSVKVILFVSSLLLLIGLNGSVAQTTQPTTENVTEAVTVAEAELTTERFNVSRVLNAIRQEFERRRNERREQTLQRTQERREQILQTLNDLSERRREYELRRQEALLDAEALKAARRQDMEARRAGRLPQRERERANLRRLEQLTEQAVSEENEIEDSVGAVVGTQPEGEGTGLVQRVRNLLLIEEADGNLRLIDLDTDEGQQYVLSDGGRKSEQSGEVTGEVDGEEKEDETEDKKKEETNEQVKDAEGVEVKGVEKPKEEEEEPKEGEVTNKRKLKIGQI